MKRKDFVSLIRNLDAVSCPSSSGRWLLYPAHKDFEACGMLFRSHKRLKKFLRRFMGGV